MDYPADLVALGLSMTEEGHDIEAAIEYLAQHSDAKSRVLSKPCPTNTTIWT